jgi:hypothetical protein
MPIEQPQTLLSQRRPDPFDPLLGMPGEFETWTGTGLKPGVARQLQPFERCADDRSSDGRPAVSPSADAGPPNSNIVMIGRSLRFSARISAARSSNAYEDSWKRDTSRPMV